MSFLMRNSFITTGREGTFKARSVRSFMLMQISSTSFLTMFKIMTNSEYVSRRDTLLREQKPFIVLAKDELVSESDNYYRIGDMQVAVTPPVDAIPT